jgi:hypothetical protein
MNTAQLRDTQQALDEAMIAVKSAYGWLYMARGTMLPAGLNKREDIWQYLQDEPDIGATYRRLSELAERLEAIDERISQVWPLPRG